MRAIGALTAALPTLTIVAALSAPSPFKCGNMAVDGYRYDLSALDKEWIVEGRITLRFNPCRPIDYSNEACPRDSTFMCAMDPANPSIGRANIGVPTEVFRNPKSTDGSAYPAQNGRVDELVILYSRGSFDMNGFPFISLVRFECDRHSKETGPIEPVTDGSKYFLIWRTRAACPVGRLETATGWLSSIIGLLFSLVLLYLILGVAFNFFVNGRRGWHVLPHAEFWGEVADFFSELGSNVKNRLSSRNGGYQQI